MPPLFYVSFLATEMLHYRGVPFLLFRAPGSPCPFEVSAEMDSLEAAAYQEALTEEEALSVSEYFRSFWPTEDVRLVPFGLHELKKAALPLASRGASGGRPGLYKFSELPELAEQGLDVPVWGLFDIRQARSTTHD